MKNLSFHNPIPQDKAALRRALADKATGVVCEALVSAALHEPDGSWVQDRCMELLSHADAEVRGVAATCLGHLARIHGLLDKSHVESALIPLLADLAIAGRVQDALDDIAQFS